MGSNIKTQNEHKLIFILGEMLLPYPSLFSQKFDLFFPVSLRMVSVLFFFVASRWKIIGGVPSFKGVSSFFRVFSATFKKQWKLIWNKFLSEFSP